ncbi:Protein phosphatase 2C 2 [Savitreella phatthalungensis]
MGQTLSEPVIDKHSSSGGDDFFIFGLSEMQGWRISMEDAHTAELQLKTSEGKDAAHPVAVFAVYDGHGGERVAKFTGDALHKIVADEDAFASGDFEAALKAGFLSTDKAILADRRFNEDPSGCTATVSLVTHDGRIFCANAGDSRTVLGIKGTAKPLSYDHKPQNEEEKARICAAGGFVDFGRVNGNLALSRAIGDFEFKKNKDLPAEEQIVTASPDVTVHDITEDDEFLVVACDGIWDCKSSQAVVEFVRRGIAAGHELDRICENVMDNCLAVSSEGGGIGCDNMTIMIVGLLQGKTKEEWYKMIQDRVEANDGPCAPESYADLKGPAIEHFMRRDRGTSRGNNTAGFDEDDEDEESTGAAPGGARNGRIIVLGDGSELLKEDDSIAAEVRNGAAGKPASEDTPMEDTDADEAIEDSK